jgi:hypothetical protein
MAANCDKKIKQGQLAFPRIKAGWPQELTNALEKLSLMHKAHAKTKYDHRVSQEARDNAEKEDKSVIEQAWKLVGNMSMGSALATHKEADKLEEDAVEKLLQARGLRKKQKQNLDDLEEAFSNSASSTGPEANELTLQESRKATEFSRFLRFSLPPSGDCANGYSYLHRFIVESQESKEDCHRLGMIGFVMNTLREGCPLHSAAVAFSAATEEELARLPPCNPPDDKRFNYRKNVPDLSKTFYSVLESFSGWPSSCLQKTHCTSKHSWPMMAR